MFTCSAARRLRGVLLLGAALAALAFLAAGCGTGTSTEKKARPSAQTGAVRVDVLDADTDTPLAAARITLTESDAAAAPSAESSGSQAAPARKSAAGASHAYSRYTDQQGQCIFAQCAPGQYVLSADHSGYHAESQEVVVRARYEHRFTFRLHAQLFGAVSGTVRDALTGEPLPGAVASIAGRTDDTDQAGTFRIPNVPAGQQVLTVGKEGYVTYTRTLDVPENDELQLSIALTPISALGEIRIVLTWNAQAANVPGDLDSHLSGPDNQGGRFHVAYWNLNPVSFANLDLDDVSWEGPETVTVGLVNDTQFVPGSYQYWVHNYRTDGDWLHSGAVVTAFKGDAQVAQYTIEQVPGWDTPGRGTSTAGVDRIWRVFSFTLTSDGVMTPSALNHFTNGDSTTVFSAQGVASQPAAQAPAK